MNLPSPNAAYSQTDEAQTRASLEAADKQNVKVGTILSKILMRDTATGDVRTLVVTSGALVIT